MRVHVYTKSPESAQYISVKLRSMNYDAHVAVLDTGQGIVIITDVPELKELVHVCKGFGSYVIQITVIQA